MKNFKSLALVSVVLLPVAVPAFAADAIRAQPMEPVPVLATAPLNTWEGGYAGIYLGGGLNVFKNDLGEGSLKNNSVKLGGYAGWNFQNDNLVYGVEGDAGYNIVNKKSDQFNAQSGFDGSLRARLGYDMGVVMPYVTAGVAGRQVSFSDGEDSNKKFRIGWTAGVGAETMLTQNISARLEYRFSDFGKKDVTFDNFVAPAVKLQSHDIRIGVGYKF
ncbi:outer membrane protein [Pseudochrobactrum kiredjianiae]|uniref:Outer membrane protein n=1 Tax=Pseudochrobactrum kiredjianiae TaxID=386305 RepID=A0ABW3V997_9HYPH|nr:outer membrane protein [Pseudochrobactrum kiredjianiae]MDM7851587.1 porin family protein [Pseudochrobactrum kiredjianiae]